MNKNVVIVESPSKAKTIEKFLGKDYKVLSSYGHIRDLKKKGFGVDIAHNYMPEYEVPVDKKNLVADLKKQTKTAEIVWLASDEDREGEAIAWHLSEVLSLTEKNTKRIAFHEITKSAILDAIAHPRNIDKDLVDAQQARRVLDRIVGFELSPVLWRKVKPALSAGRVQSVAVRLIVEREREIMSFNTEASYRVSAIFTVTGKDGEPVELKTELNRRLKTKEEALALLEKCKTASFSIEDIVTKPAKKSPAAPFTTSTLQQEAARKLGFSVTQTMVVAQRLYESGMITYMRTDSVNLSNLAISASKQEILASFGEKYLHSRNFQTKTKGAQEAHEAIRPTYMNNSTAGESLQEKRLYELIWKRTIASQMSDAELEKTTATIAISNHADKFLAEGEVLKFDGFLRVYLESADDEPENQENESGLLPPLTKGQMLAMNSVQAMERFTQRPARYTEASLVRKLEELGIGRPSTYAPTISTIQQREYVEKGDRPGEQRSCNVLTLKKQKITDVTKSEVFGAEKSKLFPTNIGIVVNDFLTDSFPNILDYNFTANVEKEFDNVAEGKLEWTKAIDSFYKVFHPVVEAAMATKKETRVGERILGTDPKTGRQVSVKIGRFGPVAQIGTADEEEKPIFASLTKNQMMETISLNDALELFKLPRTLGNFEEKTVVAAVGRFGPYIRHDSKFVSIPKGKDPLEISLAEAIELIEAKREQEKNKRIKTFTEDAALEILNGRYGAYIAYNGGNYKIPKSQKAEELTFADAMEIVNKTKPTKSSVKKATKNASTTSSAKSKSPVAKGKSKKK
ncbi:MAG: type I DNA topoisomerase [Bacteroidales bacterium]|jgi:DNA topoisomerase-1|nr:type I DNA topoisomerase [Bacteroidales bacterium]